MIYPTPEQLSNEGKYNRYTLVIAAAKCAREITDDFIENNSAEEKTEEQEAANKHICEKINKNVKDTKAVSVAVSCLEDKDFVIYDESVPENTTM